MERKTLAILIMALAGLVSGCIYPYDVELESKGNMFVIEGDINIGSVSQFSLSYAMSLKDFSYSVSPVSTLWVEGEDGTVYHTREPERSRGPFTVDLSDAPDNCRYRLVVQNHDNDRKYLSQWSEVHLPPVVDSISYSISADKKDPRSKVMDMFLSFHSDSGEKYFRWSYLEEWEYHAPIQAFYYYERPTKSDQEINNILNHSAMEKIPSEVYGQVLKFDDQHPSTYTCWDRSESRDIMLATTEDLAENRIVNKLYETIQETSTKANFHYRTTITLSSIGRDSYQYWTNIFNNSENTGGLDAPVPSQMAGNLYCEEDPDEIVIGYITVTKALKYRAHLDFSHTYFFKYAENIYGDSPTVVMEDWYKSWKAGLRPVGIMGYAGPTEPLYGWAETKCVDCSYWKGSYKSRPSDWPDKWPDSEK